MDTLKTQNTSPPLARCFCWGVSLLTSPFQWCIGNCGLYYNLSKLSIVPRWFSSGESLWTFQKVANFNTNLCGMKLCLKWHNLSSLYIPSTAQIPIVRKSVNRDSVLTACTVSPASRIADICACRNAISSALSMSYHGGKSPKVAFSERIRATVC